MKPSTEARFDPQDGITRRMLRLAVPVFIEQLLHMLVGFSDTWLVGHYLPGPQFLAAINSICYLMWMLTELFVVVAVGSTALIARFTGAGDWPAARSVVNQSLLVGGIMAVVFTTLGLGSGPWLAGGLSLEGDSAALAVEYLNWVLPTLPFIMIEAVGVAALRGAGDSKSGMTAMLMVNVVNVGLSWGLALGIGPLPEMGWAGVAAGTAAGHVVGGLLILGFLIRGRSGLQVDRALFRPDLPMIRRILRIGVPGGMDVAAVLLCQLWFLKIINQLGPLAGAAHGVAIRVESLAFLPGYAFQVSAATMVGQFLGARDPRNAVRSVWASCLAGGGFMVCMGLSFVFYGETLARGMVSAEQVDVAKAAAPLLTIVGLAMAPFSVATIVTGGLRGAGDTRWPLAVTLLGYLGVRIPLAYALAHAAGWGVQGAWYAMAADLTVRAVLAVWRFQHGGWKWVEV